MEGNNPASAHYYRPERPVARAIWPARCAPATIAGDKKGTPASALHRGYQTLLPGRFDYDHAAFRGHSPELP